VNPTESSGQRAARRYGPLGVIVVVLLIGGALVLRTAPPASTVAGGGGNGGGGVGSTSAPSGPIVDDGKRPISWSDAKDNNLNVTWGPGCDQKTGKIAIPSAFAPECFAQRASNGGATYSGVTADSIKVVLYVAAPDPLIDQILAAIGYNDSKEATIATYRGYVEIYQKYFETYGRTIDLVTYDGTGSALDEIAARADAAKIADDIKPFAVIGGPLLTSAFGDELAARKIMQFDLASTKGTAFFNDHAPYTYNVLAAPDQTSGVVAEYLGKRLKGKPAKYAGDPQLQTQTRKFGLLFLSLPGNDVEVLRQKFHEQLEANGVELTVEVGSVDPTASAAQQLAKLKESGVTTVLFSGDPLSPKNFTEEATRQNYFPEWIITGAALTDSTTFARTYDPKQWSHAFGISQLFARGRPDTNWSYYLYNWYFGKPPPATNGTQVIFPMPTIFFSGVMAAGPDLTPETFQAALFRAKPLGVGALTIPQVSFGNKGIFPDTDYNGIDDTVEIWYDPDATGPDERGKEGTGMYRYVAGGKRYLPGQWPTTDPDVFNHDGSAIALYEKIPPGDQPPDYPSPAK
jgi:hypothetical protein